MKNEYEDKREHVFFFIFYSKIYKMPFNKHVSTDHALNFDYELYSDSNLT